MKLAFIDIDTQLDFLLPAGALYVPGAETRISTIARMNQYAASNGIPLISTMDAHSEDDPEFQDWPPHCIAGTWGQKKPASTLVSGSIQTIVKKQSTVFYQQPVFQDALQRSGADRFIVYGVVTEICVKEVLFGLLSDKYQVEFAGEAARELNSATANEMLRKFQAEGGGISTTWA